MSRPALPFFKMHGLGNDFVVIDDLPQGPARRSPIVRDEVSQRAWPVDAELARAMGHRQFGVGFDQLLWLRPPGTEGHVQLEAADARMDIFNPDGSIAEMCGNGIRAAARYLWERGPSPGRDRYAIWTLGGLKTITVSQKGTEPPSFTVDMGKPGFGRGFESTAQGTELALPGLPQLRVFEVDMGNPHAVIFVDDLSKVPAETWGPTLEKSTFFPRGANIEFTQVMPSGNLSVRVWERGAGLTLACGSGASAVAATALALGRVSSVPGVEGRSWVNVTLPGGTLALSWSPDGSVFMRGPASFVYRGEWDPR